MLKADFISYKMVPIANYDDMTKTKDQIKEDIERKVVSNSAFALSRGWNFDHPNTTAQGMYCLDYQPCMVVWLGIDQICDSRQLRWHDQSFR